MASRAIGLHSALFGRCARQALWSRDDSLHRGMARRSRLQHGIVHLVLLFLGDRRGSIGFEPIGGFRLAPCEFRNWLCWFVVPQVGFMVGAAVRRARS